MLQLHALISSQIGSSHFWSGKFTSRVQIMKRNVGIQNGGERHPSHVRDEQERGSPVDLAGGRNVFKDDAFHSDDIHQRKRRTVSSKEEFRPLGVRDELLVPELQGFATPPRGLSVPN